jgi:hypothetical protein
MSTYTFGYMGWKSPNTGNSTFSMGRAQASRATNLDDTPYKQYKTQNRNTGAGGRLLALKQKAAKGDAVATLPGGAKLIPEQGGADPTFVNAALTRVRNIGYVAPPKTNM